MELRESRFWVVFPSRCRLITEAAEHEVGVQWTDPLVLISGRLVVGDPLVDLYHEEPMDWAVPDGRYSVRLVTAAGLDGVVASLIRFAPGLRSSGLTTVAWPIEGRGRSTAPSRAGM